MDIDEICDSMYWIDLNAYDDSTNDSTDGDVEMHDSGILKDTNYMNIQQTNERS